MGDVFGQFTSLPVALLGGAAGLSIITGGILDAVLILGVVVGNAILAYKTESEAETTIKSLKNLVRPTAEVIREGGLEEIAVEEVVPGDILALKPGTYVAADCRLLQADRLSLDEASLTGESLPVLKSTGTLEAENIPLGDRVNMIYRGTMVTGGQGLAVVVATGAYTELGKLQAMVEEAETPETPLEKQLDRVGNELVLLGCGVCGLVGGVGLLRGFALLQMAQYRYFPGGGGGTGGPADGGNHHSGRGSKKYGKAQGSDPAVGSGGDLGLFADHLHG